MDQAWSTRDLASLAQSIDQGATDSQIAKRMGRSERSVAQKRHAMGWLRKDRRKRPRVNPDQLEQRYLTLCEYLEILIPLAKSKGNYEIADLACEALAKASAAVVRSPDAGPISRRVGLAVAG